MAHRDSAEKLDGAPRPKWLDELTDDERARVAERGEVDADPEAVLRWLETGEGDPWPSGG
jgi:hypothetical protein